MLAFLCKNLDYNGIASSILFICSFNACDDVALNHLHQTYCIGISMTMNFEASENVPYTIHDS